MTLYVIVSTGFAFALGVRATPYLAVLLTCLALTVIEVAAGHYWQALVGDGFVQGAYILGLLVTSMRR